MTNDGTWTYSYDAEGNLTKKSKGTNAETWTYGYDNDNHMVWAKDSATDGGAATTLATYVYDALGKRIEKDVWTGSTTVTRFGYDGPEVWVDLTSGNALQTRYIYGDAVDELFARISSGGTAAWYLADRLGSVRDIVNGSGAVIDHIDYDGFGNPTETQPANGDRYKWTGREFDAETGLQYNRARYFDAHTGRWLSQDPLGLSAGDTNFYRYVFNSPLNARDPLGLQGGIAAPSLMGIAANPELAIAAAEALSGTTITATTAVVATAEEIAASAAIMEFSAVGAKLLITAVVSATVAEIARRNGFKIDMEAFGRSVLKTVEDVVRFKAKEQIRAFVREKLEGMRVIANAAAADEGSAETSFERAKREYEQAEQDLKDLEQMLEAGRERQAGAVAREKFEASIEIGEINARNEKEIEEMRKKVEEYMNRYIDEGLKQGK